MIIDLIYYLFTLVIPVLMGLIILGLVILLPLIYLKIVFNRGVVFSGGRIISDRSLLIKEILRSIITYPVKLCLGLVNTLCLKLWLYKQDKTKLSIVSYFNVCQDLYKSLPLVERNKMESELRGENQILSSLEESGYKLGLGHGFNHLKHNGNILTYFYNQQYRQFKTLFYQTNFILSNGTRVCYKENYTGNFTFKGVEYLEYINLYYNHHFYSRTPHNDIKI